MVEVGDILRFTITRGENHSDNPLWLKVTSVDDGWIKGDALAIGGSSTWIDPLLSVSSPVDDQDKGVKYTNVGKEIPDELYAQIAKEALVGAE